MKRGTGLKRTTGLKPGGGLQPDPEKVREFQARGRQASRKQTEPTRKRVRFRLMRSAKAELCERCRRDGKHVRAAHWHHWLEKEHIHVYVRGLRLSDKSADKLERHLIHDRRNLSALCLNCHDIGIQHGLKLTAEDVPFSAYVFAADLGPEWAERLRRSYPNKPQTGV